MKLFLDLDGPLLDNRHKYGSLHRELLSGLECRPMDDEEYWQCKRSRTSEREILDRCDVNGSEVNNYIASRLELLETPKILERDRVWPGVLSWLSQASEAHALYIVTLRKRRAPLMQQLQRCGLAEHFVLILNEDGNDGTHVVKQRLLNAAKTPGEPCAMIGDTEADIDAAKACGMPTIAVTCGIRSRELLERSNPDRIVESLTDLQTEFLFDEKGSLAL